jgi:hypothetical protein
MSNKNQEQWINSFFVKIVKSASEMLNGLWRNSVFLNSTGGLRKGEKMCKMTQEVGSQTRKGQMQMWTEYEPWYAQIED